MSLFKKIFFLLKPMMRVALLIITNSCNASYTPQDVRYYDSSQTASRLPLYQHTINSTKSDSKIWVLLEKKSFLLDIVSSLI